MAIVFSLKNLSIRNKILAHLRIDTPKRFRPTQPMRPRQRITVEEKGQHQKKNVRAKQPWFVAKILRLNKVVIGFLHKDLIGRVPLMRRIVWYAGV
jgi:hypothetical protein